MNEKGQQLIASISKAMAMMCVRNTMLEEIHASVAPECLTGDFTDVVVIDGKRRGVPWPKVSRLGTAEMACLMRPAANRPHLSDEDGRPSLSRHDGPNAGRSLAMGRAGTR